MRSRVTDCSSLSQETVDGSKFDNGCTYMKRTTSSVQSHLGGFENLYKSDGITIWLHLVTFYFNHIYPEKRSCSSDLGSKQKFRIHIFPYFLGRNTINSVRQHSKGNSFSFGAYHHLNQRPLGSHNYPLSLQLYIYIF